MFKKLALISLLSLVAANYECQEETVKHFEICVERTNAFAKECAPGNNQCHCDHYKRLANCYSICQGDSKYDAKLPEINDLTEAYCKRIVDPSAPIPVATQKAKLVAEVTGTATAKFGAKVTGSGTSSEAEPTNAASTLSLSVASVLASLYAFARS